MKAILFAATTEPVASQEFYRDVLGLTLVEDQPFATVYDIDGIALRVQKVEQLTPQPHTALGFEVDNVEIQVQRLAAQGVEFERYPFLEQDSLGIWTTADGARIAWCKDPDGNVVSLTQQG